MNHLLPSLASRSLFAALAFVLFAGSWASADDRFSISVGTRDLLVIAGANGDRKAELPLPSISQTVTVEGTTFQVSYGRDANDLLTAIIAPNPSQPQDLHFTVLSKSIDSDRQAVVTLTFSKGLNRVKIDPGYVGVVQVDAQTVRPDSAQNASSRQAIPDRTPTATAQSTLGDAGSTRPDEGAPATVATTIAGDPAAASSSSSSTSSSSARASALPPLTPPVIAPVPVPIGPADSTVAAPADAARNHVSDHDPEPMQVNAANQMPFSASATPGPSTVSVRGSALAPKQHPLFWAEPITPPSGVPPSVGINQMKLVQVVGSVSVRIPGGDDRDAQNGMIIPSGSTLITSTGGYAAVFMGGVDSIRLLPDTEVQINQEMNGSIRKTLLNLRDGTVFSRVGHRQGETQDYQVQTPEGIAVAKGTILADCETNGHHYVYCVKGVVGMISNGTPVGTLTALPNNVASGAMPPAADGNKIIFAALTMLQPFQSTLQTIIGHINTGSASGPELAYYNDLKNTFNVLVDDVYDPTHPNAFIGDFESQTGFGDSVHSSLERPQDFGTPNPNNAFNNGLTPPSIDGGVVATSIPTNLQATAAPQTTFFTQDVDVGATSTPRNL